MRPIWTAITPRERRRRSLSREIRRVARDDLQAVAASIAELEPAVADPGPARDAYFLAVGQHAQAEERLAVAQTVAEFRAVARLAAAARHQIACAHALLAGQPAPEDASACFFDPAHGLARRVVVFAPDGGDMRQLPACEACAEEVDAGRAPPSRRVIVDGRPQPYWRSRPHAGYFGSVGDTLDDLLPAASRGLGDGGGGVGLFDWLDDLLDVTHPHHH